MGVDKLRGRFKVAVYMGSDLVREVRQAGRAGLELVNNSAVWNHHFGKRERDRLRRSGIRIAEIGTF